jgi:ligand-binding sensor domain-containing protein/two-component sensor histidine kinase
MCSTHLFRSITATLSIALTCCAHAERLPLRTFTAADGLGSAFVSHIMQDRAGFMWFSTRDGLSRYNGYEFTTFGSEDGLSTGTVRLCIEAPSGRMFVLTNGEMVASVKDSPDPSRSPRFAPFLIRGASPQPVIQTLVLTPSGILWGGSLGCVVRDIEGEPSIIQLDSHRGPTQPMVWVSGIREDRYGHQWVATTRGLYSIDGNKTVRHYTVYDRNGGDVVQSVAIDGAGRIWIGHRFAGVIVIVPDGTRPLRCKPGTDALVYQRAQNGFTGLVDVPGTATQFTTADGLTSNDIRALHATPQAMWMGTANGLTRFDGHTFSGITTANGLCSNVIHSLTTDVHGGLWFGSPAGAMCLPPDGFVTYLPEIPVPVFAVATIGHEEDGTACAVTQGWWINRIRERNMRSTQLHVPSGATAMWASQLAYHDRHGRWWSLTSQGLCRYEKGPGTGPPERVYTERDGLPSRQIFRLYEDSHGTYWIGTRTGDPKDDGMATLSPDLSTVRVLDGEPGLPAHRAPSAFAEDHSGALWIGMYSGGIVRWKNHRFRSYGPAEGIPGGMVTDVFVDAANRLWIATATSGILRVDDPSRDTLHIIRYTRTNGLASNNVRCLAGEDADHLWAGTVRGVDRLEVRTGSFRHFTMDDGLAGDFVTAAHRDPAGVLWFGTFQGVSSKHPDGIVSSGPPSILITGIRIGGELIALRDPGQDSVGPLTLKDDQRDLAIDFSSIALYTTANVAYQYTMSGEKAWRELSFRQRTVNFARLAPGDYVFRVRAIGPDGTPSVHPASVAFRVLPPFWRTWWFILANMIVVACVLLLFYRARVRKLRELARLRMRLASDLHDELASNLSSIAMFSALLQEGSADRNALLERITALATGSAEVVREIIWSIDPKVETVASLVGRLRDMMITACRARGIHLLVTMGDDGDIQHVDLSPEQRKNLWLMLKEALNNALKHSGCTELAVDVSQHGEMLCIAVRDNGRGWDGTPGGTGRGAETMKMRAGLLGGTLSVEPHSPSGTCLVFFVRIQK